MWKGGWTEGTGGPGWPSCTCIGGDKDADQKYKSFVIASHNTKTVIVFYSEIYKLINKFCTK